VIPYFEVPVIHLGPLPIHGFGILVALGFMLGGNVAIRRANRSGLDGEHVNRVLSWLVAGTFIGGHIGYGLMYKPAEYFAHPIEFLKVWQGLSSFGGFVVCIPLAIWYFRKHRLPIWHYMDCIAVGLALGWFLGRMACTVAHDHPGTPANDFPLAITCRPVEGHTIELPSFLVDRQHTGDYRWGPCAEEGPPAPAVLPGNPPKIQGPRATMVPADFAGVKAVHDMGFYEALWSLAMFLIFLVADRFPKKPGVLIALFFGVYGPVRYLMDDLRPPTTDPPWFVGTAAEMTPGQFWSLVFAVVCLGAFARFAAAPTVPYGPTKPYVPADRQASAA
jgi:prolipoprotein diacylglyceryl transferase